MDRYWFHAGLYLVDKEFRYITILRIILLLTKHYKKNIIFLFIFLAWSTSQIIYSFFSN